MEILVEAPRPVKGRFTFIEIDPVHLIPELEAFILAQIAELIEEVNE